MNEFSNIKGIGPKIQEYLKKLEIYNIQDLITHYPFRYEVLSRSNINELKQDDKIIIDGIVESNPTVFRFKRNMNRMNFNLNIGSRILKISIFNRAFLQKNIIIGRTITVIGKYDLKKNSINASDILFSSLSDKPTIIPIYRTTTGLNRKTLNNIIQNALSVSKNIVIDYIPEYLSTSYLFLDKYSSLLIIHNPNDIDLLKKSMIRLKYEELFLFMLKINYLKLRQKQDNTGYDRKIDINILNDYIKKLPFELTVDQNKSLNEIISDLNSNTRMNRLLQGDVGSGKTIVALLSCYAVIKSGYQCAFMVPTEILARQHYQNTVKLFNDINVELLTGSLTKKQKESIYKRLENKEIDLIIGTHSLIQDDVKFNSLGLIITDEQHRFGVNQRSNLRNKGNLPDVLYMSATPIPRTYALTIYGDMDISTIKTVPKNKKSIITYLKSIDEIKEVLSMIKNELDNKHQVYVVAPLIEDDENSNKENVEKLTKRYELAFKNYNIGMLHGKMKQKEKDEVMEKFISNEVNILISTTVIEVGVDVSNATMIVIHDADLFGLSTLHQLRGRVGRNDLQSYCVLIGSKDNERLKTMVEVSDGFELSERDFKLRGSGDLFGIRQSGDMHFKIADITKDYKILMKAKDDSMNFLENKLLDKYPNIKKELSKSIKID
jgi:ATP-dependent DNA helicase RecG